MPTFPIAVGVDDNAIIEGGLLLDEDDDAADEDFEVSAEDLEVPSPLFLSFCCPSFIILLLVRKW